MSCAKPLRTALHIAAGKSGMYGQYEGDDPLLEAIDNFYQKDDTLEIIRLLVERADCEPMAEIFESSQPLLDSGVTAMHLHKGPAEPMKYLLTQDKLVVDPSSSNYQGYTVVGHFLFGFPTATTRHLLHHLRTPKSDFSMPQRHLLFYHAICKLMDLKIEDRRARSEISLLEGTGDEQ